MIQEKLLQFFDKHYGIGGGNIYFDYKDEKDILRSVQHGISYHYEDLKNQGVILGENIEPPEFLSILHQWIEVFKNQEIKNIKLDNHDQKVIDWIEEKFGRGVDCHFCDYDSGNKLMTHIQEDISMEDHLTMDCGVGPLRRAITFWIQDFAKRPQPDIDIKSSKPLKNLIIKTK